MRIKSINEVREEMGELDLPPWGEVHEEYKDSLKRLNKAGKIAAKHRKRITRIEWVLVGFMIGICGLVIWEIVEWIRWIFWLM